jgi:F0F1-type ATP synthase assembly protein I
VSNPADDRFKIARAYDAASRIIVVALEMVLPGLAGYWLDCRLGTVCLFLVIGMVVGCTGGVWHLIRYARQSGGETTPKD